MLIGYVRVSTAEQNSARQEVLMRELGVEKVYLDEDIRKSEFYQMFHRKGKILQRILF